MPLLERVATLCSRVSNRIERYYARQRVLTAVPYSLNDLDEVAPFGWSVIVDTDATPPCLVIELRSGARLGPLAWIEGETLKVANSSTGVQSIPLELLGKLILTHSTVQRQATPAPQ